MDGELMSIQLHSENVNGDLNWEKLVENDKVWFASQIGLFKEGSMTRNTKKSVMENISKRHMNTCIELATALALKQSTAVGGGAVRVETQHVRFKSTNHFYYHFIVSVSRIWKWEFAMPALVANLVFISLEAKIILQMR